MLGYVVIAIFFSKTVLSNMVATSHIWYFIFAFK